jgi:hypothetical protein
VCIATAEARGRMATAVANNLVRRMLNSMDGCKLVLTTRFFFPTQVPSSIDINIYRQRQWDIRTCARSSLDPGMQVPPFIFQCQRQPCIDFSQSGREGSASEAQHD